MSTQTLERKSPKKPATTQEKPVDKSQDKPAENRSEQAQGYLMPPVSIFENDEFVTVQADLPGVSKDRVTLQCEQGSLSLEGELSIELNADSRSTTAVQSELRTPRFRRSFVIGNELDTQNIKADMADGVLTIRIPKKPSAKPFKIPIV